MHGIEYRSRLSFSIISMTIIRWLFFISCTYWYFLFVLVLSFYLLQIVWFGWQSILPKWWISCRILEIVLKNICFRDDDDYDKGSKRKCASSDDEGSKKSRSSNRCSLHFLDAVQRIVLCWTCSLVNLNWETVFNCISVGKYCSQMS